MGLLIQKEGNQMKFENVVSLTQNAVSQVLGESYQICTGTTTDSEGNKVPVYENIGSGKLATLDSSKLVDIGTDVLSYENNVDKYAKSLITQMSKMVNIQDEYEPEIPSIMIDASEWGGFQLRQYYSPQELIQDEMYNLIDGNVYEDHRFYKPRTTGRIFAEGKTIMCPISIVREQLFEAFKSWNEMDKFLSGIYQNVRNTVQLAVQAYQHMLVSGAYAVAHTANNKVVHLLTEYNSIAGTTLTAEKALVDKGFYQYAGMRIAEIKDNMRIWSTAYNNGAVPQFTNPSRSKVLLLSKFSRGMKYYAKADTFNKDELGFGKFETIATWQATKSAGEGETDPDIIFGYDTVSTIKIKGDPDNKLGIGTSDLTLTNCLGLIYDYRAIGMTLDKEKVTTNYTAIADFWNEYLHKLVNYIVDANCNMVALALD